MVRTACCLTAMTLLLAGGAQGQSLPGASALLGGAVTIPAGDLGRAANVGWLATGGFQVRIGDTSFNAGVSGLFGANRHRPPPGGDQTRVYGGAARGSRSLGELGRVSPFAGGILGFLTRSFKSQRQPGLDLSVTGPAVGAFFGVDVPLSRIAGFVEAWWLGGLGAVDGVQLGGVTAGVRVPLGRGELRPR